jgi:hypothetical protein
MSGSSRKNDVNRTQLEREIVEMIVDTVPLELKKFNSGASKQHENWINYYCHQLRTFVLV